MKTFLQLVEMHSLHFDKPPTGNYRTVIYGLLDELMSRGWLTLDALRSIAPTKNTPLMIKAKEWIENYKPDPKEMEKIKTAKDYLKIQAKDFYIDFLGPNTNLWSKPLTSLDDMGDPSSPPGWNEKDEDSPTNIVKRI